MKNRINLKIIVAIIITSIISCGITAFASIRFQANEIGYDTTTVADALDSLYQTQFSNNYSTSEKIVGKWIDGKPLYQKTFTGTSPSATGEINTGLTNIDFVFVSSAIVKSSEGYSLNIAYQDNYVDVKSDGTKIYFSYTGSTFSSKPYYVTLQYTKTTDTAPNNN